MGRPRSIQTGDGQGGARLEYIRTRRMLRLGGWREGRGEIAPIEVPALRFLADLGIEPDDLGATPLFVIVGGVRDQPRGAVRHVILAFASELEARRRFRRLRARHHEPDEWARLVTVDARCRVTPLSWFGEGAVETASEQPEVPAGGRTGASGRRSPTLVANGANRLARPSRAASDGRQ